MEKIHLYQTNPDLWIKEVLDDYPRWPKQTEIIKSVSRHRKTYVRSCHGIGKTFSAKDAVLWFLYTHYPCIVITTAPSWTQVSKLLWTEINSSFQNAKTPLGGVCIGTELKIDPRWFAFGMSPRLEGTGANRMAGFHSDNILIVLDEAPAVDPRIWEMAQTMMTSDTVRLLAIGNPVFDHGHFFDGFRDNTVNKITMSIFDSPNFTANGITKIEHLEELSSLTNDEREKKFNDMFIPYKGLTGPRWAVDRLMKWGKSSPIFISRVIGDFPTTSLDTIIPLGILESAREPNGKTKGVVMGVDVARFGSDNTVFFVFDNGKQIYKEIINGQDLVTTANTILGISKRHDVGVVVIDDTGLGGGVTDILNDASPRFDVIPVNFAEKARDQETYDGIVTEMYFHAKQMLEEGTVQARDEDDLFSQLSSRKYKYSNKGLFRIESKDDYKKRTGQRSPDEADAFCLALWGYSSSQDSFSSADGTLTGRMYE